MQQRIPLAAIAPGETVRVAEIHVEGALRRRLFDLGLIPQTLVSCRFAAPAGFYADDGGSGDRARSIIHFHLSFPPGLPPFHARPPRGA